MGGLRIGAGCAWSKPDDGTKSDKYNYVSEQRMLNGMWVGPTRRVAQEKQ